MLVTQNRASTRNGGRANRSLITFFIVVGITSLVLSGCRFSCSEGFGPALIGNGEVKTVSQDVVAFDEVEFDGIGSMEIVFGDKPSVTITADENIIEVIKVEVNSNRLRIDVEKPTISKAGIDIKVVTPKLKAVDSQGAVSLKVESIDSDTFLAMQSGVGSMRLSGKTGALKVVLSGAGKVDANQLKAQKVDAIVSGVGSVKVYAEEHLKARVSGAGSVTYRGEPKVESHVSGVGNVSK